VLTVKSLHTEYAGADGQVVKAAQDVSFEVPDGALFTLLGPSGCGKTTTLRSIAGLERPRHCEIELGGHVAFSSAKGIFVPPDKCSFVHPSLRTPTGDPIHLRMRAEKCVAIALAGVPRV